MASSLRRYVSNNFTEADIENLVGDEIARMFDPEKEYFKTYARNRGRLRDWIKQRIRNQVIDPLRKQSVGKKDNDEAAGLFCALGPTKESFQ